MKQFAELLNKLYFTYGHLDKMKLINHFFSTVPDPERGLALAILADEFSFPTIKRTLIKALIQKKTDPVLLDLSYHYVGDLSETIALLWPDSVNKQPLPLLSDFILTVKNLTDDKLADYLENLLDNCSQSERWALLKLTMGGTRIGVSARFLKKTLARFGQVDVQDIEKIWYGLKPPYLNLFSWLEKKTTLPDLSEQIYFHPVMLSHPLSDKELELINLNEYLIERKYDGIRVQIVATSQKTVLFTRTGDKINDSFPDAVALVQSEVILDGELVVKNNETIGRFNELQKRLNRKNPSKNLLKSSPAALILYDILKIGPQDLRSLPLVERRKQLEQWVSTQQSDSIYLSSLIVPAKEDNLVGIKEAVLAENHPAVEGLMIKHKQSPYLAGRPKGLWYKWKRDPLLIDAVMMYAQRGHGKRSSYFSDYTFGLWQDEQLLPIGKAYSGFSDDELLLLDKWVRHSIIKRFGPVCEVKKELVLEIAFDAVNSSQRHKSGIALRFPRINRIRWDKPAAEADILQTIKQLIT